MDDQQQEKLIENAISARQHAHAPYSSYQVGAAVLTASGKIYQGCNVENASYGLSICAERVALAKAVSEGARTLQAIAIASAGGGMPCGACRQFLAEFCDANLSVVIVDTDGAVGLVLSTLGKLFPQPFTLD